MLCAAAIVPQDCADVGRATPNGFHITCDWEKPMRKTAEYLYSLGHRRMAFIGHHEGLTSQQAHGHRLRQ